MLVVGPGAGAALLVFLHSFNSEAGAPGFSWASMGNLWIDASTLLA